MLLRTGAHRFSCIKEPLRLRLVLGIPCHWFHWKSCLRNLHQNYPLVSVWLVRSDFCCNKIKIRRKHTITEVIYIWIEVYSEHQILASLTNAFVRGVCETLSSPGRTDVTTLWLTEKTQHTSWTRYCEEHLNHLSALRETATAFAVFLDNVFKMSFLRTRNNLRSQMLMKWLKF